MAIVLGGLGLQLKNKPFAESPAERKRWRSMNKQAAFAELCKFVAIACGLLLTIADDSHADGTLAAVISTVEVVALLAPPLAGVDMYLQNNLDRVHDYTP